MIIAGPLFRGEFISRYVELRIPDDIEPHLGEGKMPFRLQPVADPSCRWCLGCKRSPRVCAGRFHRWRMV